MPVQIQNVVPRTKAQSVSAPKGPSFRFFCPMVAFEKADESEGKRKRIGGIISTDELDQQDEVLVQEGLNFDAFVDRGWFNDNHKSDSAVDIVGYPEAVTKYKKGDTLPNGSVAEANLTWTEGYLVGEKGDAIWRIANDLQGSGRHLGFSVEGQINKRTGPGDATVADATISQVAITACPVNQSTELEVLARSMAAFNKEQQAKAFTVGTPPPQSAAHPLPQPEPNVPAPPGQVIFAQYPPMPRRRAQKKAKKSLNTEQALKWVHSALPGICDATAREFLETTQQLLRRGLI